MILQRTKFEHTFTHVLQATEAGMNQATVAPTIHKPHSGAANRDGERERVQITNVPCGICLLHSPDGRHVPASTAEL